MTETAHDLPRSVLAALDRLGRARRAHHQALAERLGLTPLQLELLRTVGAGSPPDPTVGRLASELAVSQPTVTASVHALQRKGLVVRTPDPRDARRTLVRATANGLAVIAEASDPDDDWLAVISGLPADRAAATLETLLDLVAGLVGTGAISVARTCLTCRFHAPAGPTGHHCTLLGRGLPTAELRVDCPEHRPV